MFEGHDHQLCIESQEENVAKTVSGICIQVSSVPYICSLFLMKLCKCVVHGSV